MPARRRTAAAPEVGPFRIMRDGEPGYAVVCPRCSRRRGWMQHNGAARAIADAAAAGLIAYTRARVESYVAGDDDTCKCGSPPTVLMPVDD